MRRWFVADLASITCGFTCLICTVGAVSAQTLPASKAALHRRELAREKQELMRLYELDLEHLKIINGLGTKLLKELPLAEELTKAVDSGAKAQKALVQSLDNLVSVGDKQIRLYSAYKKGAKVFEAGKKGFEAGQHINRNEYLQAASLTLKNLVEMCGKNGPEFVRSGGKMHPLLKVGMKAIDVARDIYEFAAAQTEHLKVAKAITELETGYEKTQKLIHDAPETQTTMKYMADAFANRGMVPREVRNAAITDASSANANAGLLVAAGSIVSPRDDINDIAKIPGINPDFIYALRERDRLWREYMAWPSREHFAQFMMANKYSDGNYIHAFGPSKSTYRDVPGTLDGDQIIEDPAVPKDDGERATMSTLDPGQGHWVRTGTGITGINNGYTGYKPARKELVTTRNEKTPNLSVKRPPTVRDITDKDLAPFRVSSAANGTNTVRVEYRPYERMPRMQLVDPRDATQAIQFHWADYPYTIYDGKARVLTLDFECTGGGLRQALCKVHNLAGVPAGVRQYALAMWNETPREIAPGRFEEFSFNKGFLPARPGLYRVDVVVSDVYTPDSRPDGIGDQPSFDISGPSYPEGNKVYVASFTVNVKAGKTAHVYPVLRRIPGDGEEPVGDIHRHWNPESKKDEEIVTNATWYHSAFVRYRDPPFRKCPICGEQY